jgi:poly(3-hydroxybutyrate) depolymerase
MDKQSRAGVQGKWWGRPSAAGAARPALHLRFTTRLAAVAALVSGTCLVLLHSAAEQRALWRPAALDEAERWPAAEQGPAARKASAALEAFAALGEAAETAGAAGAAVASDTLGSTSAAPALRRSGGCATRALVRSGWREVLVGNLTRRFFVGIPPGYDPAGAARPVLVLLHGRAVEKISFSQWFSEQNHHVALQQGWLVVVPLALNDADLQKQGWRAGSFVNSVRTWGWVDSTSGADAQGRATCHNAYVSRPTGYGSCEGVPRAGLQFSGCSWGPCGGGDRDHDAVFFETLLDHVQATLCVDPANVLLYGVSMGAMLTWYLAALPHVARRLRAVAVMNARPERGTLRHKGVPGDLPLLSISGTKDRTVPPGALGWHGTTEGLAKEMQGRRGLFVSASEALDSWAGDHGCELWQPTAPTALTLGQGFASCYSVCLRDPEERPRVVDCRGPFGHFLTPAKRLPVYALMVAFFRKHLVPPSKATPSESTPLG